VNLRAPMLAVLGLLAATVADLAVAGGGNGVGFRIIRAESNGRPFDIAVWYPTDAPMQSIEYGSARVSGQAAPNAPNAPIKAGHWPLVVFAHGYSGSGIGSATIAEIVASYGVVWAAPDFADEVSEVRIAGMPTGNLQDALRHLGNKPPSLSDYGYRIDQMRATVERLLAGNDFAIDPDHVALAGHSLGAWTAMHLAFEEPRAKAIVLYSMGELNYLYKRERFFSAEDLSRLNIPAYYVYGSKERQAVQRFGPPNSVFAYRNTSSPACLAEVAGGNHFVYVNREVARGNGGSAEQLQRIAEGTVSFLARHLLAMPVRVAANECKPR
jgi:pimeloyl-ACP methyl ester carboxylesterase